MATITFIKKIQVDTEIKKMVYNLHMGSFFQSDRRSYIASAIFVLLTVWWVFLQSFPVESEERQLFAAIYGFIALLGGIWGIMISNCWGGINSIMGKAIFLFSLGLFAQEFGQLMYSYYIYIQHSEVPYPSLGDAGYFLSIPIYIYGVLLIAKASGVNIALRSYLHQTASIIIPSVMLVVTYIHFLRDYRFDLTTPIKIVLDFGYPLGQAVYISLALTTFLLSTGFLGGLMKNKIRFIILALIIQYVADYMFLYQASIGTWYAGGVNDYIYLLAYYIMTLGLLQLDMTKESSLLKSSMH